MAATKTNHPTLGVQFHSTDASGNHVTIQQTPPAPVIGTRNLTLSIGGTTFTFSPQTLSDLSLVFSNFVAAGALT
jgi:hypothetical protein